MTKSLRRYDVEVSRDIPETATMTCSRRILPQKYPTDVTNSFIFRNLRPDPDLLDNEKPKTTTDIRTFI